MENRSFEGESPSGNPPKDPKDNPPGLWKPQADPSDEIKDQAKESNPPLARITNDGDEESPPAYVRRYMPQEQKMDDLDLELPPPEPVQEQLDVHRDPEFLQQATRRRERRYRQNLVEGPVSLRPDTHHPPLPVPEPYPDPDIGQQPADAPNPGQQVGNAADPGQQLGNAPDPGQQLGNAPDPGQQLGNAPHPGQQVGNAPDPEQHANNVLNNEQQAANTPAGSLAWERWVSCYQVMNSFTFQFPFNTLLLTCPLSTAVMGVVNLTVCPLKYIPWLMIVVGLLGLITILIRLYLIYYEQRFTQNVGTRNYWIVVRTAELITWIFFASLLYYFFERAPSFTPGEEHYCKQRFYKINCGLMFLSSALMIGWIVLIVGIIIRWFSRKNERPST